MSLEKIVQSLLSGDDLIPRYSSPDWAGMREEVLLEIDQGLAWSPLSYNP